MAERSQEGNYLCIQVTYDSTSTKSALLDDLALTGEDETDGLAAAEGILIPVLTQRLV